MSTLEEVAKLANVSVMTVSRVINHPGSVNKKTKDKILKIINQQGYYPNLIAKSLVMGTSHTIGVLYSNIYNQAYLDIIMGIDKVAYKNNYAIMNANVDNYDSAVQALNMILSNKVDGIIILPMEMSMSTRKDFKQSIQEMGKFYEYLNNTLQAVKVPAITISEKISNAINVNYDFAELAKLGINYLLEQGFRDISMISSSIRDGLWKEKEEVYSSLMKKNNLEKYINIKYNTAIVKGGYLAMDELLSERTPQAVFCANDYMAIGALQAISAKGLQIPKDISVIGNDNVQFCEMTFPQLTTVSLNTYLSGEKAMEMLLNLIKGSKNIEDVVMEHNVVIRDSVKKVV